jgi:hypothetical protein
MLPHECKLILQNAAKKKDPIAMDAAIAEVKKIDPASFFWGDHDPSLRNRVFFHRPFSYHWSGTSIMDDKAAGYYVASHLREKQ